ncbi:hypothetical protein AAU57_11125 [Nonlabens sp. YIK11]|uniref:heparan-alpha-glucosaminide N-acetyltransferase domain-containing protein n=1 Tax=Nonlabens sp. YIK11 TaxID=1453349 RepID=UPI0006DC1AED|nr:heparan-alpha-glucosaminide N-acetyltransferase domain-containing protein [Nonlabens sp. YIK11]KQC33818.1 hypothetical protein AAU57_11125 [Nonlabens sp. YIK11]
MNKDPQGKPIALLAYASAVFLYVHLMLFIAVLGVAILLNFNKNQPFAAFHHRQMLGIACIAFLITAFGSILPSGWIAFVLISLIFLMAILGFADAYKNQTTPLPYIGEQFQKWFTFIK